MVGLKTLFFLIVSHTYLNPLWFFCLFSFTTKFHGIAFSAVEHFSSYILSLHFFCSIVLQIPTFSFGFFRLLLTESKAPEASSMYINISLGIYKAEISPKVCI